MVQAHHVGHRSERDQVEQVAQVRCLAPFEGAAPAQFRAQRQHDVEHDAATGDRLAREGAAGLVRIDDDVGRRQRVARQVMVGHQYRNAEFVGARHAVDKNTNHAIFHVSLHREVVPTIDV